MLKKVIISLVIIVVLVGGFFVIKNKNSSQQTSANVRLVNMIEAEEESLTTRVIADGSVNAETERDIKVKLSGIVKEVYVETGDSVNKNDKLYKLDDRTLVNSLETARINLEEAKGNYQSLLDKYQNQDNLNKLKLEESEKNLEIAILSYEKEKSALEDQQLKLEEAVAEAEEALADAKEKYENDKYLYKKDAITENALKQSRDAYQQAKRNYDRAQNDLEILVKKTIPNSLKLAQLKVENARNQLDYLQASIATDRITENDVKMARLNVKKVERQIEDINSDLEKIVARAPMAGTIISLELKEGDKIMEGATVGKIADLNNFIVEAMVDEIDINEVEMGQDVKITSDSFADDLSGKVSYIAPAGTKVGNINKYKTEIKINEDKDLLRPGMFVNCEIVTNRKDNIIAIPSLAILGEEDKYIFVVADGKAEKRPVEIGLKNLSKVEIKGVKAGEKIITGPFTVLKNLKEGVPVASADKKDKK